jgi:hypothetical protein
LFIPCGNTIFEMTNDNYGNRFIRKPNYQG